MAESIEPFANISARDLLENGSVYHGWVRKRTTSGLYKFWESNWPWHFMILRTGYLYLYKDSQDKDFCETIPLEKYSVCDAQEVKKSKWSFKLIHRSHTGQTLFFAVDSELDLKKWKEVIIDEQNSCWPVKAKVDQTEEKKKKRLFQRSPAPDPPTPDPANVNVNPRIQSPSVPPQLTLTFPGPQHEPKPKMLPRPPRTHSLDLETSPVPEQATPDPVYVNVNLRTQCASVPPKLSPKFPGPQLETKPKVLPKPPQPQSSVSGPLQKLKPTWPLAQSFPTALVSVPVNEPRLKGPSTLPRPLRSVSKVPHGSHTTTMRLPKSSSEACLTRLGYDDVVKQLTCKPLRSVEEGDIPASARLHSTAGVSSPCKLKPLGRGLPEGQSFKEKHSEMAPPSEKSNDKRRRSKGGYDEGVSSTLRCDDMGRMEAESCLQNRPGVYILRNSDKAQAGMVLSVCTEDEIIHYKILYEKNRGYALSSQGLRFRKIEDLLSHYFDSYVPYK